MLDSTPRKAIRTQPDQVYAGVAAQDLPSGSQILQVICPELLPNALFGTVAAGITTAIVNLQDRDGNAVSSQITSANHIVCSWRGQSNTRYPPMVRKGEPVDVIRVSNQDKFYWQETGRGRDFRTVDKVHVEVAATDPTKPGVAKDDTNTYSAYLDSDGKKVGFKTSKKNGEVAALSCEADLAAGTFHLSDDSASTDGTNPGNRLFLDTGAKSGTPIFQVNLSSGVTIKMQGNDCFIKVPGKLEIDATERFVINSPIFVFNLTQAGTFIINAANMAINTAKDLVVTAGGVVGLNTASVKVSGVLIAMGARVANAVKGAVGASYKPTTIAQPQTSAVSPVTNAPDTSLTGPPYQT